MLYDIPAGWCNALMQRVSGFHERRAVCVRSGGSGEGGSPRRGR